MNLSFKLCNNIGGLNIMFYERIKLLADMRNEKITTILKKLDINTSYTGHWKNGTAPNAEALLKLQQYFDVSIDYMLGVTDNPEVNR